MAHFCRHRSALVASSSFVATSPVASIVIIPPALVGYLNQQAAFANHPQLIVVVVSLCVLLAGIVQALFGALNIGRIIKFTPHPVIAGFLNSVALAIIAGQLYRFLKFGASGQWPSIERPAMLTFVLVVAAFIADIAPLQKKVPAPLLGLFVGTTLYTWQKRSFQHWISDRRLARCPWPFRRHPHCSSLSTERRAPRSCRSCRTYCSFRSRWQPFCLRHVALHSKKPIGLWVIRKGSLSVRLEPTSRGDPRRVASMGAGTTVGEMALLEVGKRSASVVCDEDVECYELSHAAFEAILHDHPLLARKHNTFFARELVQRIRVLNDDLRLLNG